jgi:hypothetical protein
VTADTSGYYYTITPTVPCDSITIEPAGDPVCHEWVMPGAVDELEEYLAEQMRIPSFARAYAWAGARAECSHPRPLCINGHEYHRRHEARRKRHGR